MYMQSTPLIAWQGDEEPAAKPVHTENKAAARRRRQMERQQLRRPAAIEVLIQVNMEVLAAIEDAQAALLAVTVEALLEPPSEVKRVTQAKLVEWFQRWRKPIRSWLRNRGNVPDGEIDDLAQEVFVRLLKYSDQVLVDNPQGYLFRIASNVANEWREKARVRYVHDADLLDELVMDSDDQPDAILEREFESEHIQAAVDRLPSRQREVLLTHVNEGLTYKQVAQEYDLTYRMVLRDLTKAYSTLRSELR